VLSVGHALSTELAAVGMLGSGSGDKRPRNEAEAGSSSEDKRPKGATLPDFDFESFTPHEIFQQIKYTTDDQPVKLNDEEGKKELIQQIGQFAYRFKNFYDITEHRGVWYLDLPTGAGLIAPTTPQGEQMRCRVIDMRNFADMLSAGTESPVIAWSAFKQIVQGFLKDKNLEDKDVKLASQMLKSLNEAAAKSNFHVNKNGNYQWDETKA
jgi:hypothetical protein